MACVCVCCACVKTPYDWCTGIVPCCKSSYLAEPMTFLFQIALPRIWFSWGQKLKRIRRVHFLSSYVHFVACEENTTRWSTCPLQCFVSGDCRSWNRKGREGQLNLSLRIPITLFKEWNAVQKFPASHPEISYSVGGWWEQVATY